MRSLLLLAVLAMPAYADSDEYLDRAAITEGVAKVKSKITACATNARAAGTVKVKVEVVPAGTVKSVEVMTTPDKALGDCVAAAFRAATFRATKTGGTFSYPLIFDGKTPPADPPPLEADSIDRAAISEAMAKVRPQLVACANGSKAKGTVKVKVEVAPAGTVKSITVVETPDKSLGECVVTAVKGATFRSTKAGGTFSYPFVFDGARVEAEEAETIDRAAIADVVATLKPKVIACGDASKTRGTVKVKVEVAPAGTVTTAVVMATPDPKLGECVAELFRHAAFPRTAKGGTFSYPFVF